MGLKSFTIVAIGTRDTGYGHLTRALTLFEALEKDQAVTVCSREQERL